MPCPNIEQARRVHCQTWWDDSVTVQTNREGNTAPSVARSGTLSFAGGGDTEFGFCLRCLTAHEKNIRLCAPAVSKYARQVNSILGQAHACKTENETIISLYSQCYGDMFGTSNVSKPLNQLMITLCFQCFGDVLGTSSASRTMDKTISRYVYVLKHSW